MLAGNDMVGHNDKGFVLVGNGTSRSNFKEEKMKKAVYILTVCFGLIVSSIVFAGELPMSTESPYAYGTAVIAALGLIKHGTDRMPGNGPQDAAEVVAILEKTRDDFAGACTAVKPFSRSTAAEIRTAAHDFDERCGALRNTTAAISVALKAQAAGKAGANERMNRAIQEKDLAWGKFLVTAAQSMGVLVELRDDRPTGMLRVTKVERKALRSKLEKTFGKAVEKGKTDEQDPLARVVAGWNGILSNPPYRGSDEL